MTATHTGKVEDAHRFQNALRIMWNLDQQHLVDAGVYEADDWSGWVTFRETPMWATVRLDEDRMARLFALIESRQP